MHRRSLVLPLPFLLAALALAPAPVEAAPNCTPENINPQTRNQCMDEVELLNYCAFETLYEQVDPGIQSISVRVVTGNQPGDDSDGRIWVRLDEQKYFLDHPRDDFTRGEDRTFELMGTGLRRFSDISRFEIGNDTQDGLGIEALELRVNGALVFETPQGFRTTLADTSFEVTREEMNLDLLAPSIPRTTSVRPFAEAFESLAGHHIRLTGLVATEIEADQLGKEPALDVIEANVIDRLPEVDFLGIGADSLLSAARYFFEEDDLEVRVNWLTGFDHNQEEQSFEFHVSADDPSRAEYVVRFEILIRESDGTPFARSAGKLTGGLRVDCFDGRLLVVGDGPLIAKLIGSEGGDAELEVFKSLADVLRFGLEARIADFFLDEAAASPTDPLGDLVLASGAGNDTIDFMHSQMCPSPHFTSWLPPLLEDHAAYYRGHLMFTGWDFFHDSGASDRFDNGDVPDEELVCPNVDLGDIPWPDLGGGSGGVVPDGVGDFLLQPNLYIRSFAVRDDGQLEIEVHNNGAVASNQTYLDVFYDQATPPSLGDWGQAYQPVPSLEANEAIVFVFAQNAATHVDVLVDTDEHVNEWNEDDNASSQAL